jgi:branched-chain amino acid transport system substrate-binding protein
MRKALCMLVTGMMVSAAIALPSLAQEGPLVVGIAMAQSGWMAEYDQPSINAALLKIEEINGAGGLLGHQLKAALADTKTDRAQGARAAKKVLAEGAKLVIIPSDYDFGGAAGLAVNNAGVIAFSPGGSDPRLGIQGIGPFVFSMATVSQAEGFNMAEYSFKKLGSKTAYCLIDQTTEYTKDVGRGFNVRFEQLGGKLLGEDVFKNDDPSFSSQVTRIKNLPQAPDVIAICSYPPGGPSLMRQLRAAGVQSAIMGDAVFDGDYWLDAVPGLSNFYYPAMLSMFGNEANEAKQKTLERYVGKYGKPAVGDFLFGYSVVEGWALAVERAGTFDPKAVRTELEKFRNEELTVGSTTYTSELHITTQREMMMMNIEDGKHRALGYFMAEAAPSMDLLFPK